LVLVLDSALRFLVASPAGFSSPGLAGLAFLAGLGLLGLGFFGATFLAGFLASAAGFSAAGFFSS